MNKLILTLMALLIGFSGCTSPDANPYDLLLANTMGALAGVGVQSDSTPAPSPNPSPRPGPAPPPPEKCPLCDGVGTVTTSVAMLYNGKMQQVSFTPEVIDKMAQQMVNTLKASPAILLPHQKVTKEASPPESEQEVEAVATAVNWATTSLWDAQEQAAKEGKHIFVQWTSPSCGPCKVMAREVFGNDMVSSFMNENFITCEVDTDSIPESVLKSYKVSSWPTSMIITKDWKHHKRMDRTNDPHNFLKQLDSGLKWANSPQPSVKPVNRVIYESPVYYEMPWGGSYNGSCGPSGCSEGSYPIRSFEIGGSSSGGCSSGGCSSGSCGGGGFF